MKTDTLGEANEQWYKHPVQLWANSLLYPPEPEEYALRDTHHAHRSEVGALPVPQVSHIPSRKYRHSHVPQ